MPSPIEVVDQLVDAINRGDLERAVGAYASEAVMVVQPGRTTRGPAELREALAGFIALDAKLTSEAQEVIEAGDVALYMGRWSLRGTDPSGKPVAMSGESADVLHRQADGRWLVVLDNPWGARILASRVTG
jgi:uncharacterized protein (TIGR02246 family)